MQPDRVASADELPPGWRMTPLSELCFILSGGTPPKSNAAYWQGSIPWVSGKDLKTPRLYKAIDHVSENAIGAGTRLAPAGAVFILVRGMGLARDLPVALAMRPMAFNQDIKALVPKRPGTGAFIRTAIYNQRQRLLSRIVTSAHGTMTLNLDDIETFEIPVPNDPLEVAAIEEVITVALDAAVKAKDQFNVAKDLKREMMRSLFTVGLRGGATKDTEIGRIPAGWNVADFSSIREWLQYGTSIPCSYTPSGLPVLRIPNIEPGHVNAADLKFAKLSAAEAARYRLENGDLIFIRTNGVIERLGACAVYSNEPPDALFASYLIRARLKLDKVDPRYVAHFFGSDLGTSIIAGRATPAADGKYNLNTGTIDGIPLPLPPSLDEQREIIAVLDAIDRKIDLHRKKRGVLDDLFKALMHKLMTGQIRVADLDLSALAVPTVEAAA